MKPWLFLHGALGASVQLQTLKQNLGHDADISLFDFPQHGSNSDNCPFTMQGMADYLYTRVNQLGLEGAHVFGYSMGGYAALTAEAQHPGLFVGIVTLATKFDWNEETARMESGRLDAEKIAIKFPQWADQLHEMHTAIPWQKLMQQTVSLMMDMGRQPLLHAISLQRIQCPVCLGLGDRDKMVSLEETLAVYKQLPQASFYILPHTAHPIEQVPLKVLAQHLLRFSDMFS